jgi:hypothetical protein
MDAEPDILNHNTETVPRLYRVARSGARYERTLRLLERAKEMNPAIPTKTGVMAGLGESTDELLAVFRDLAERKVDILTIGQYLRPSKDHLPVARLYPPDEFRFLKEESLKMGFRHVESGPLVRSSYHAHEQADAALASLDRPGVIVTAAGDDTYDFISRYFAPAKGIPEDPVTGAAHCMLAPYWAQRLGKRSFRAFQASRRGGEIVCRLFDGRVELEGSCVFYMEGEVDI